MKQKIVVGTAVFLHLLKHGYDDVWDIKSAFSKARASSDTLSAIPCNIINLAWKGTENEKDF